MRKLFASIHGSDNELQRIVEPLAEEGGEGLADQADHIVGLVSGVNPKFWTPLRRVAFIGGGIFFLIVMLFTISNYISEM